HHRAGRRANLAPGSTGRPRPQGARHRATGACARRLRAHRRARHSQRTKDRCFQGLNMSAAIIDGKAIAEQLRAGITAEVSQWRKQSGRQPGFAVVLMGSAPASEVYVGAKARQTVAVGMQSFEHRLPRETSQTDLIALIARLNSDEAVDGILVQLP